MSRVGISVLSFGLALSWSATAAAPKVDGKKGGELATLARALPVEARGFRAEGEVESYTSETIFRYLDGGAEVYKAYGMRGCLARRYTSGAATLVLDLFDLGSPADAFGVFTYDQDGEELKIGQGALLRPGWLSFWKGRFFVSISADGDQSETRQAVTALAGAVAALLPGEGTPSRLVSLPPEAGRKSRSLRYFHDSLVLSTHLPSFKDADALGLTPASEAVLAGYERAEGKASLLIVRYPEPGQAGGAARKLAPAPSAPTRPTSTPSAPAPSPTPDGTWRVVAVRDGMLAFALDSTSAELAAALVSEALERSTADRLLVPTGSGRLERGARGKNNESR